jgi:hypothetical protein
MKRHFLFLQIIDGVFDTIQSTSSSQSGNSKMLEALTHNVLLFLSNSLPLYKSSNTMQKDFGLLGNNAFFVLFVIYIFLYFIYW